MAVFAQKSYYPCLLVGRKLCKNGYVFHALCKVAVAHAVYLKAKHYLFRLNSNLLAYTACYLFVVACKHLYRNAVVIKRLYSRGCCFLRRVKKRQKSQKHHIRFIGNRKLVYRRRICFVCHSYHAHSSGIKFV